MSDIKYQIVHSGSKGNAVIINENILIDCGVPIRQLSPQYTALKLVLLTHIHSDHFNKTTIKALAQIRPTLRFACGEWLVKDLTACGVPKYKIDILQDGKTYNYRNLCSVEPFLLTHNVSNCGYKLHFADGSKMIYATDTNNLNGITAKGYGLYMLEANYSEDEIKKRIDEKKENGQFAYEMQVLKNHLSKEKCDDFIYRNIQGNGEYVYLHQHEL